MTKRSPPQNEDTFHKARSRLIDAFAQLEARVVVALRAAEKPIKGDTLATKLKTLSGIPNLPSDKKDALDNLLQLIGFRADLVHGAMVLVDIDDERFASFRNARLACEDVQSAALVSYSTLKKMADQIAHHSSILI